MKTIPKKIRVLDVALSLLVSYEHAADIIVERIRNNQKTFCVAINPEKICHARRNDGFKKILDSADLHICDGVGTKLAARMLLGCSIARITGVQLFSDLIKRAEKENLRVFLLGARPEVNEKAAKELIKKYPDLNIAGQQHGYFEDDSKTVDLINDSQAEMLFVGMGSPRQEEWIATHRSSLTPPLCMGVGGTLDVLSGHVRLAPAVVRKTGFEWLYRLMAEPRRIKRQMVLPGFALTVLGEWLLNPKAAGR